MTENPSRQELVLKCFQRGESLNVAGSIPAYRESLDSLLRWLLEADQVGNDQTTSSLNLKSATTAQVICKQDGIIAGLEEADYLLRQHTQLDTTFRASDGSPVEKGQAVVIMSGDMGEVLAFERTTLNLIGRMSGIATQTRRLMALTQGGTAQIAGTRKAPYMLIDKKAIYCGGGLTHRLNLADGILIKDNHLRALATQISVASVEEAIPQAIYLALESPHNCFEIEVETAQQGHIALETYNRAIQGKDTFPTMVVMLDNFTPQSTALFIDEIRLAPVYAHVVFEASGDVTEETVAQWSQTGVDVVSLGALTHSVKNFNVSMAFS